MDYLVDWGLVGLFAGSFLAATILPFSSEALFLILLGSGYDPLTCLIVATLGNSLGGATNLLLGRWGRKAISGEKQPWGVHLISRYGSALALLSWVPVVGDPLLIALGYYRTPWMTTLLFMVAGKLARYMVLWYGFELM
jgi:membrane protein YqaA with SNARE-associated domain